MEHLAIKRMGVNIVTTSIYFSVGSIFRPASILNSSSSGDHNKISVEHQTMG